MAERLAAGAILLAPKVESPKIFTAVPVSGKPSGLLEWPTGGKNHQTVEREQVHSNNGQSPRPHSLPPAAEAGYPLVEHTLGPQNCCCQV